MLVGTDSGYAGDWRYGGNVARTLDGGASWALSPTDLGGPVHALAKDSSGSAYYAGTSTGDLYRSLDRGANWSRLATLPDAIAGLVVDPTDGSVLYAASPNRGVLRRTDGGMTWWSFNEGMASRSVSALTIDATGKVLHVGTDQGVFDLQIAPSPEPGPCAPGALALLDGRFRVRLTARDPASDAEVPGLAIPQADRFGAFSLPGLTGDPGLPEIFVKMLDAGGGSFLFFQTGLTHLDYDVTVLDTVTQTQNTYVSRDADARRPCGAARLLTFPQGGRP